MGDKQLRFFGDEEEQQHTKSAKHHSALTKKDVFLMSFFAFLSAGLLITAIFFVAGNVTGNYVFDISGGEEGIDVTTPEEEVEPVVEVVIEDVEEITEEVPAEETEEATEEVVEEETTEEPVVEEESLPCGESISIETGEVYDYGSKEIELKLLSGSSAQVSVDGKLKLLTVGSSATLSGLDFKLEDTTSTGITFSIAC